MPARSFASSAELECQVNPSGSTQFNSVQDQAPAGVRPGPPRPGAEIYGNDPRFRGRHPGGLRPCWPATTIMNDLTVKGFSILARHPFSGARDRSSAGFGLVPVRRPGGRVHAGGWADPEETPHRGPGAQQRRRPRGAATHRCARPPGRYGSRSTWSSGTSSTVSSAGCIPIGYTPELLRIR